MANTVGTKTPVTPEVTMEERQMIWQERQMIWQERQMMRRLYRRSFFIQAVWNYRGMQNLGLMWAQLPLLKACRNDEEKRAVLEGSMEFYNGHPYLATLILGLSMRLEPDEGRIHSRLKRALVSPLGALGDRLFWQELKPLMGLIAMLGLLAATPTLSRNTLSWWLLLPLGTFLLYSSVHLLLRWKLLEAGYHHGKTVAKVIHDLRESPAWKRLEIWLPLIIGIICGALISMLVIWLSWAEVERLYIDKLGSMVAIAFPVWSAAHCYSRAFFIVAVFVMSWRLPARHAALPALLAFCIFVCLL